jgi:hypothetical protein
MSATSITKMISARSGTTFGAPSIALLGDPRITVVDSPLRNTAHSTLSGDRGHPSEGTCQEKNQIPLSAPMISRKDTLQPVQPDGFSEALDAPQLTGRLRSDVIVDPKP